MSTNDTDETGPDMLFERKPQMLFVYVKIPVKAHARPDPFHQRENELARLLQEAEAGDVIGWGQSLSDASQDGAQHLMHQRIDITTSDIAITRSTLRTMLTMLVVPSGTEIHYTRASQPLMDVYASGAWRLEQPVL